MLGHPLTNNSVFWVNIVSMVCNGSAASWLCFAG